MTKPVDVLVAGLGTAGSIALLAAARQGARVLGVEAGEAMGGIGTRGCIPNYFHGAGGGLYEEVDREAAALAPLFAPRSGNGWHPAAKVVALDRAAHRAGAEVWYGARVVGVRKTGNRITGAQVCVGGTIREIDAAITIDATGDAAVSRLAGCGFRKGRESDGQPQPFSFPRFCLNGNGISSGVNFDAGLTDSTDDAVYSRDLARALALPVSDAAFADLPRLLHYATLPGLREGPLVEGEAGLRFSDMLEERIGADALFRACSVYDTHHKDLALESEAVQEWIVVCALWYRELVVGVPYGVMLPKGVEGLLTAGRCVSMDHDAAQHFRMMRDLQKLGEAAGVAAALAARRGTPLRAVPVSDLQRELEKTGCRAPVPEPGVWLEEPDAIRAGLVSSYPGPALWSCRRQGAALAPALRRWLAEGEPDLAGQAALALGLLRDPAALPVLRSLAAARDGRDLQGPRRKPVCELRRGTAALCLLGLMRDVESIPLLLAAAADPAAGFQDATHAAVALTRIAARHPERKAAIREALGRIVADPAWRLILPLQTGGRGFAPPVAVDRTEFYRNWLLKRLDAQGE